MRWWTRRSLTTQIVIGVALGVIAGLALGARAELLAPVGDIFLRLLRFLIIPLVVTTLLAGVIEMGSARQLGRIGIGFFAYLTLSSLLAACVGVMVALTLQPGRGANLGQARETIQPSEFNFVEQLVSWVPDNLFTSFVDMNMIQIIFATILTGIALILIGEDGAPRTFNLVREATRIVLKITDIVIALSPYGIFALIAVLVGTTGTEALRSAALFVAADYLAMLIVFFVAYPTILTVIARVNPVRFIRNTWPAVLFAGTTSSSSATIPMSMEVQRRNNGTSEQVYGFSIPFGATANMDGFAVALGVIAVFAANVHGLALTPALIAQIVLLGLVLSIGAAGVRGAGIVMTGVLLEALGLPLTILPLMAAIWPLIDIGHTALNVTSDHVGTVTVSSRTGDLDREAFNGPNRLDEEESAPAPSA